MLMRAWTTWSAVFVSRRLWSNEKLKHQLVSVNADDGNSLLLVWSSQSRCPAGWMSQQDVKLSRILKYVSAFHSLCVCVCVWVSFRAWCEQKHSVPPASVQSDGSAGKWCCAGMFRLRISDSKHPVEERRRTYPELVSLAVFECVLYYTLSYDNPCMSQKVEKGRGAQLATIVSQEEKRSFL